MVYRKVQTYDRITAKYRRRPPPDSPVVGQFPQQQPGVSSVASESGESPSSQTTNGWRSYFSGYHSNNINNLSKRATRGIHDDDDDNFLQHGSVEGVLGSHPGGLEQIDEREADAYAEESPPVWDIRSRWKRWQLKRQIFREDNPRTAEVFHQALWYLGVFYLTHVWSTTNRTIQLVKNGRTYFGITVIHSFFDPLQGFLNFLVYQRPRYVRIRKSLPELGCWGALEMALMFTIVSGEDPLRRPVAATQPRRWPFASRNNPRLSSVDDLTGEFYIPDHRERISSVSGVSELVVDAAKPEHLSVVPEDSTELSNKERKDKNGELEELQHSMLNSKGGDSERETNDFATPCCNDKIDLQTAMGETAEETTSDDSNNREDVRD